MPVSTHLLLQANISQWIALFVGLSHLLSINMKHVVKKKLRDCKDECVIHIYF